MDAPTTLTIALPDDLAARGREAVQGGGYPDAAEVVRDAPRLWSAERDAAATEGDETPEEIEHPRRLIAEADASGPPVDAEAVFDEPEVKYTTMIEERERAGAAAATGRL